MVQHICLLIFAVSLSTNAFAQTGSFADTARTLFRTGRYGALADLADQTWAQHNGQGETAGQAAVALGAVHAIKGDCEQAERWYDRAETLYATLGDEDRLARLPLAVAIVRFLESRKYGDGAPTEALACLEKIKEKERAPDLSAQMVRFELLGRSSKAMQVQDAYLGYMKLIRLCEASGDSLTMAHCVLRLARVDGSSGGHRGALAGSLRAAHIFREAGDLQMLGWALRNAGHAQRKIGAYDEAERLLTEAAQHGETVGDRTLVVWVNNDLSRLYAEAGDDGRAVAADRKAAAALADLAQDIQSGRILDTVQVDYYHLLKLRFASLLPYALNLDLGFYDQLLAAL